MGTKTFFWRPMRITQFQLLSAADSEFMIINDL